ncbi:hypothetical protein F5Y16DRAFT_166898 [Xylariaceae sp. FL0255]|nr:hypothetical protein F5Y16DRAFT_166898 [Xylariaceae sp. FL0255]
MSSLEIPVLEHDQYGWPTLASRTRITKERFKELIAHVTSGSDRLSIPPETIIDTSEKFNLWTGNIAAHSVLRSSHSHEARLESAVRILEQMEDLLDDIASAQSDHESNIHLVIFHYR